MPGKELNSIEVILAGAISGSLTRFLCQPLDVLKILFQLQIDPKTTAKYPSVMKAIPIILNEEGIAGLWKGHIPAQLLSMVYGGVQFCAYEQSLKYGRTFLSLESTQSDNLLHFYAGAMAGTAAVGLSFPFDTIRTRLIAQTKAELYSGTIDAGKKILKAEGFNGFYKGFIPAFIQIAPSSSLVFGFKNIYNHFWMWWYNLESMSQLPGRGHFLTGMFAGLTAKTLVYPLDLVKKRLQVQGMNEKSIALNKFPHCDNISDCIHIIFKREGVTGFFKGVSPALIKAGVVNSINFTLYYQICRFLHILHR